MPNAANHRQQKAKRSGAFCCPSAFALVGYCYFFDLLCSWAYFKNAKVPNTNNAPANAVNISIETLAIYESFDGCSFRSGMVIYKSKPIRRQVLSNDVILFHDAKNTSLSFHNDLIRKKNDPITSKANSTKINQGYICCI